MAQPGRRSHRICLPDPHAGQETGRLPGADRQANRRATGDQARFYITTRLEDTLEQVVQTVALRWTVETLFADFKELMGSDQYQLHSAEAILRFWALGLCLYQYLDSLRHRLERLSQRHLTIGETLAWLRQRHDDLRVTWICTLALKGVQPLRILGVLTPALPPLALANC